MRLLQMIMCLVTTAILLSGCGAADNEPDSGLGGTGGKIFPTNGGDDPGGIGGTGYVGQAYLGPVIGGHVAVYELVLSGSTANYGLGEQLCQSTTRTADASKRILPGSFLIPADCILDDNSYYVVEVSGGLDIDYDDDGIKDNAPTQVEGKFHSVLTGSQIKHLAWKVSFATELAYQVMLAVLQDSAQFDLRQIENIANLVAVSLLTEEGDINQDGIVDSNDLLEWHALDNRNLLRTEAEQLENAILLFIHDGALHQTPAIDITIERWKNIILEQHVTTESGNHIAIDLHQIYVSTASGVDVFDNSLGFLIWMAHLPIESGSQQISLTDPEHKQGIVLDNTGHLYHLDLASILFPTLGAPIFLNTSTLNTGTVQASDQVNQFIVVDKSIYSLVTNNTGVSSIVVSDANSFTELARLKLSTNYSDSTLLINQGNLYVISPRAENPSLLVDLDHLDEPLKAETLPVYGKPTIIDAANHQLIVYQHDSTCLKIYEVSTSTALTELSCTPITNIDSDSITAFAQQEKILLVGAGNELIALTINDPTNPSVIDRISFDYPINNITIKNDRVFVTGDNNGLMVLPLSLFQTAK